MSDREQTPAKGNPQDRKRFLFFGQLSGRKNLRGVVEALESLPFLVRRQIELCVAGPMESGQERATADLLRRLCALEGLAVDAVLRHLSSAETADVFADADIVLLPYMQHVGMSSVLVLAARASKPVIATCCGLLGHLVRERCLGISADCSDLHNLAGAFRQALSSPPHTMYDAAARRQLANDHAVEYFGAVIARGIDANIC
jgi:glycosyltransferase involved in cell wall biosynthesis